MAKHKKHKFKRRKSHVDPILEMILGFDAVGAKTEKKLLFSSSNPD
jgi:hypothetical protein